MSHQVYDNPLVSRYASSSMAYIWSDQHKHGTWRKLWVMLAEAQRELGLDISESQLGEMRAQVDRIDFEAAWRYERELRHDVMAHVHAFGDQCPAARPIIHLGATSCFVTDNTELMLIRESLEFIRGRLVAVIHGLGQFAAEHRATACLGLTHLQPAQPTTVGKRACIWAHDLVMDLEEVEHRLETLRARSTRGTTGTQASFLELFQGDHAKVRELERRVAEKMGFRRTFAVTGQTYSRKVDSQLVDTLSGIAQSAHKTATDIRLLASRKELEEPFEQSQIGSSAMPYKRNPMRSERICSLARYVMSLQSSPAQTAATQWMERTLDDSANRRLVLPQATLGIDAILILCRNVVTGMVVYPQVVSRHLREELPFMASENILMAAVKGGGDRQELHERMRQHSQAAAANVKQQGGENDLLQRLANDEAFRGVDFSQTLETSRYVGRAPQQVDDFLKEVVEPIRQRYQNDIDSDGADVHV